MLKLIKQFNFKLCQKDLKGGFTLLETIVAIGIFVTSVLAMMTVLGSNLSNLNYNKQKIIATYLAEEGVEYMRSIRDTYALYSIYNTVSTVGWEDFRDKILPCDSTNGTTRGCYFDYKKDKSGVSYDMWTYSPQPITNIYLSTCSNNGCPELYYQPTLSPTEGEYNYEQTGTLSGFVRQINTRYINANEVEVTSTVYWSQGSGIKRITFTDYLFNWIE